MVPRIEQVKFHIQSDDYFSTLATILDLTRQIIHAEIKEETDRKNIQNKKIFAKSDSQLGRLRDELMFLQNNYKIVEKKQGRDRSNGSQH